MIRVATCFGNFIILLIPSDTSGWLPLKKLVCFSLFAYPLSDICNIRYVSFSLQFKYYKTQLTIYGKPTIKVIRLLTTFRSTTDRIYDGGPIRLRPVIL